MTKTKADKDWQNKVARLGCLACEIDGHETPEVLLHHITTATGNGKKSGHREVIPLCFIHHDHKEYPQYAIHADIVGWEKKYKTQKELLELVNERIG
jgi:hypothetical protein